MSGLIEWMRAALEVADSEDMPDSEVIPTWPELLAEKYPDMYPPLKVGHLRECRHLVESPEMVNIDAIRGRMADLESRAIEYLKTAPGLAEPKDRIKARMNLEDAINHCPDPKPFILRTKADAVSDFAKHIKENHAEVMAVWILKDAENYIQSLNQQADSLDSHQAPQV